MMKLLQISTSNRCVLFTDDKVQVSMMSTPYSSLDFTACIRETQYIVFHGELVTAHVEYRR